MLNKNLANVLLYAVAISGAALRTKRDVVTNDVSALGSEEEQKSEKLIVYDEDSHSYVRIPDSDVSCLLNTGPCSVAMGKIKNTLLEALKDDCKNCDYDDRVSAGHVLGSIIFSGPDLWTKFVEVHDNRQSEEQVEVFDDNALTEQ